MKIAVVGLLVGLLIGGVAGFFISDYTAYSTTKALQKQAFVGGMIVFCTNVQDSGGAKIFTSDDCDGFGKQYLSGDLFEQWYELPTPQP